jgi:tripartite-type tricarboxylate transporter receptor subunit TctC
MRGDHRIRAAIIALAMLLNSSVSALAQPDAEQSWPQRAVKLIVPLGPGSASDIGARLLAERLQVRWGRPVTVENRPGGESLIGLGAFVAAKDNHVLFYGATGAFTVHPYQHAKLPYDINLDLQPIARTTVTLVAVGVPASMGVNTLREFVDRAKAEPGELSAAVVPGITELVFDGFTHAEQVNITKVPFRDIVQAGTEVGEGRIQFIFAALAILRPHVTRGRMKLLAVTTPEPSPLAPGVPTVIEAGVPSLELEGLNGLFGPKGMPLQLRERIAADVIAALGDPDVAAKLAATGQAVSAGGPAELAGSMANQIARVDGIAKELGIARKLNK